MVVSSYNTESLTSVTGNASSETVNATKFTVDRYGRLTAALTVPTCATATEGTKMPSYDAGTSYSRYDIITNASKVYQALKTVGVVLVTLLYTSEVMEVGATSWLKRRSRKD